MQSNMISITICLFLVFMPALVFSQNTDLKDIGSDLNRVAIYLTASEREAVLSEMRVFLDSTRGVVKGVSENNMALIVESARKSGRAAGAHMPKTLHKKLPAPFKKLGSDTHRRFDELALDAEQLGDEEHALSQLGSLLNNCVSCHASFRIEAK